MLILPLIVTIHDSRRLRLGLMTIHLCCAAALFLAAIEPGIQFAGLAVLIFSMVYYWRPLPAIRIRGDADGIFYVWRQQKWQVTHLSATSVILPGCTLLRFTAENRWRTFNLVVLPDSLSNDEFRQLRVWLRWRGSKTFALEPATMMSGEKPDQ